MKPQKLFDRQRMESEQKGTLRNKEGIYNKTVYNQEHIQCAYFHIASEWEYLQQGNFQEVEDLCVMNEQQ